MCDYHHNNVFIICFELFLMEEFEHKFSWDSKKSLYRIDLKTYIVRGFIEIEEDLCMETDAGELFDAEFRTNKYNILRKVECFTKNGWEIYPSVIQRKKKGKNYVSCFTLNRDRDLEIFEDVPDNERLLWNAKKKGIHTAVLK